MLSRLPLLLSSSRRGAAVAAVFAASLSALPASATLVTVPSGLSPGDTYRLVFVTSTTRDALSSNIADYNTHTQAAANAVSALNALGTSWNAIASTASVDARDNTSTNFTTTVGEPIYRLDDTRVANNYADFWDSNLAAPISLTELETTPNLLAWTGTNGVGQKDPFNLYLGSNIGVEIGATYAVDGYWIGGGYTISPSELKPLYAISGLLRVPVPEPGSLAIVGSIAMFMLRRVR